MERGAVEEPRRERHAVREAEAGAVEDRRVAADPGRAGPDGAEERQDGAEVGRPGPPAGGPSDLAVGRQAGEEVVARAGPRGRGGPAGGPVPRRRRHGEASDADGDEAEGLGAVPVRLGVRAGVPRRPERGRAVPQGPRAARQVAPPEGQGGRPLGPGTAGVGAVAVYGSGVVPAAGPAAREEDGPFSAIEKEKVEV